MKLLARAQTSWRISRVSDGGETAQPDKQNSSLKLIGAYLKHLCWNWSRLPPRSSSRNSSRAVLPHLCGLEIAFKTSSKPGKGFRRGYPTEQTLHPCPCSIALRQSFGFDPIPSCTNTFPLPKREFQTRSFLLQFRYVLRALSQSQRFRLPEQSEYPYSPEAKCTPRVPLFWR